MSFSYEVRKSIQLLLFVIQSLGGKTTPNMVFIIFYLADLRFLSIYGRITFSNFYMAMKNGPVPYNILSLLMELNNQEEANLSQRLKTYFIVNDEGELINKARYNPEYLSKEEVETLFMTIQTYKKTDLDTLKHKITGHAWQQADANSIISAINMAEEINANAEIIQSLTSSYTTEKIKTIVNEEKIKAAKLFTGE